MKKECRDFKNEKMIDGITLLEDINNLKVLKDKVISMSKVMSIITSGTTIMMGGFISIGGPNVIIQELLSSDIKDLTIIGTTTGFSDRGWGQLISLHKIKKVIVSHIGTNPDTVKLMNAGEIEVEFVPLGTLIERIRAGGYGLGGILTPIGVGTLVENGKQKIVVDGIEYLLEKPLRADMAIIRADIADKSGNLICRKSARNFNTLMPFAADVCIAEVREIREVGDLDPDDIHVPHPMVDYIVKV